MVAKSDKSTTDKQSYALQIRMTEAERKAVAKLAKQQGKTISGLIKDWIADGHGPTPKDPQTSPNFGATVPDAPVAETGPQPPSRRVEILPPSNDHTRKDGTMVRDWHFEQTGPSQDDD